MKILHTSDWHLGKTLYGRRCYAEFTALLDWMIEEIERQQVECLLVAGDIFDTTTPSNTIQSLYYSFLHRASQTCCRHVVIIGGNHDSPSLLHAPRQLLHHLHVTVVGCISDSAEDEVITLFDSNGIAELIVCAVPFLRDRDVRQATAGESIEDKAKKLVDGIREHYHLIGELAVRKREQYQHNVPIVAMGHLFAAGGKVSSSDEIRDLYVGSLAHVHASIFPQCFDYLALGHLHIAQQIGQSETIRYSGSPLSLSFGKGNRDKSVTIIDFQQQIPCISRIAVPRFLRLESLAGSKEEIIQQLDLLLAEDDRILLEILFAGEHIVDLQDTIQQKIQSSHIELLRTVNTRTLEYSLSYKTPQKSLENMDERDVFQRCLDTYKVEEEEREELDFCFSEILQSLDEDEDGERQK